MNAEIEKIIEAHNKEIDDFVNIALPARLKEEGYKIVNGWVSLNAWFTAQTIIKDQNFYCKGMKILRSLRSEGWDVKMDMQSNKLVFYGRIEEN